MAFEECTSITRFLFSHFTGYDQFGNPLYDRAVDDAQWSLYETQKLKDGILYNDPGYYKVEPYNGMRIIVRQGFAQIKGRETYIPEDYILEIEPSGITMRIDRIVIQLNLNDNIRDVKILAKKGETSLVRSSTIWEFGIADITIGANVSTITAANIKDIRLDPSVCGIVDYIYKLDTGKYFTQFDDWLKEAFADWENNIADKYDIINSKTDNFLNLVGYLETQAFTLINNNFDDISVKTGTTLSTEWLVDGRKMETRVINYNGNILCTRETIWGKDNGAAVKTAIVKFYDNVFVINDNMVRSTNSQYREITRYGRVITREVL